MVGAKDKINFDLYDEGKFFKTFKGTINFSILYGSGSY
jgi:hypothetical protein